MGEISYRPLIEDMVWSYSRIDTYKDCPHRFYLKYIKEYEEEDMFYASFGKFMHGILEDFYLGNISKDDAKQRFLTDFKTEVKGFRPKEETVARYIEDGYEYLKNLALLPFNMIAVEKRVNFTIGENKFCGFIDYIGEKDGKIYIVDNKSRRLKPRSNRAKPTQNDMEIDDMLKQLYLYSVAVEQEYGQTPEALCFNCFLNGEFIKEQFYTQKYEEVKQWAIDTIEEIKNDEDFNPNESFFSCNYICGLNLKCIHNINQREERRRY